MKRSLDFVVFRTAEGFDVAEGVFAVRELRRLWPVHTPVLVAPYADELRAALPTNPQARGLLIHNAWLALDVLCLERLHAALDAGFEVALACDSTHPDPMAAAAYATARGMERFVEAQASAWHEVPGTSVGLVELVTVAGLARREGGEARTARVEGAWAHDASAYFAATRQEVLPMVPPDVRRVLDVGGGHGGFLAALKAARPEVETHLAELTTEAASYAQANPGVDHVWVGEFQKFETTQRFDCISFLEVLEHFEDPERALARAKALLSPGGVVVASIPNVGHWSVVADLLEGRWDWAAAGIHCYTHVRFFTQKTVEDMFVRAGFKVVEWSLLEVPGPPAWLSHWSRSPGLRVDSEALNVYAYLVRAVVAET